MLGLTLLPFPCPSVCTQLLVSRPDEENITSYLQLIEKCLTHEVRPPLGFQAGKGSPHHSQHPYSSRGPQGPAWLHPPSISSPHLTSVGPGGCHELSFSEPYYIFLLWGTSFLFLLLVSQLSVQICALQMPTLAPHSRLGFSRLLGFSPTVLITVQIACVCFPQLNCELCVRRLLLHPSIASTEQAGSWVGEWKAERKAHPPCFTLPILGVHGDAEETAAVLETASAEAPPDLPAQSRPRDAELPAAERVSRRPGCRNLPSQGTDSAQYADRVLGWESVVLIQSLGKPYTSHPVKTFPEENQGVLPTAAGC